MQISDYGNELKGIKTDVRVYRRENLATSTLDDIDTNDDYIAYIRILAEPKTIPPQTPMHYKVGLSELQTTLKWIHNQLETHYFNKQRRHEIEQLRKKEDELTKEIDSIRNNIKLLDQRAQDLVTERLNAKAKRVELEHQQ